MKIPEDRKCQFLWNIERFVHAKPRWSPKAGSFWSWLAPTRRSVRRVNKQGGSAQSAYIDARKASVCVQQSEL